MLSVPGALKARSLDRRDLAGPRCRAVRTPGRHRARPSGLGDQPARPVTVGRARLRASAVQVAPAAARRRRAFAGRRCRGRRSGSPRSRRTRVSTTRRRTRSAVPRRARRSCSVRPGTCTATSPMACTGARTWSAGRTGRLPPSCCGRARSSPGPTSPLPAARPPGSERDLARGPARLAACLGLGAGAQRPGPVRRALGGGPGEHAGPASGRDLLRSTGRHPGGDRAAVALLAARRAVSFDVPAGRREAAARDAAN